MKDFEPWEINVLRKISEDWFNAHVALDLWKIAEDNVWNRISAGEEGYGVEVNPNTGEDERPFIVTDGEAYKARMDEEYERLVAWWKESYAELEKRRANERCGHDGTE